MRKVIFKYGNKRIEIQFLEIVIYRLILELVFNVLILPYFTYKGMNFEKNILHYAISWWIVFFIVPVLNKLYKLESISNTVLVVLIILNYIPGTVYYSYSEMDFFPYFTLFYMVLLIANKCIPYFTLAIRAKINSDLLSKIFLVICVGIPLYIWGRYAGFRVYFDILRGIYALRSEASQYNMPTMLLYGFKMIQTLLPILMIYFWDRKDKIKALVSGFALAIVFFIDGSRSAIFSVLVAFAVYFVRIHIGKISKWIVIGMSVVSIFSIIELLINKTYIIGNMIINRLLFMPNLLNYFYYDFFSKNEFDYYRAGFLSHLGFESVYNNSLPKVIGELYYGRYYGNSITNANNGLFADAYANLGIVGVIILPIITIVVLRLYDACAEGLEAGIKMSCVVTAGMKLISDSIFTCLLSGGIFATYILLLSLPRKTNESNND